MFRMKLSSFVSIFLVIPSANSFSLKPTISLKAIHVQNDYRQKLAQNMDEKNTNEKDDWYSDYNPSEFDQRVRSSENRSDGRGQGRGDDRFTYTRDTSRDESNVDVEAVLDLLSQRGNAKRKRDFDTADSIRDDLLANYSVAVDDRNKSWRTGGSRTSGRYGGGTGRIGKMLRSEKGHDYKLSPEAGENSSDLTETEIHSMLAKRLSAKFKKDYDVADSVQSELISAGVFVSDTLREWRADGMAYNNFKENPRSAKQSRNSRSNEPGKEYVKSTHSGDVEGADDELIQSLVDSRTRFKMVRDYEKADKVRDGLREKYNVEIDDKIMEWSVNGDFGKKRNDERNSFEVTKKRGYVKSQSSLNLSPEDEEIVKGLIKERAEAKKNKDYESADEIRDQLISQFSIKINDVIKLWSVGGYFEEVTGELFTRMEGGDLSDDDVEEINYALLQRYHADKNGMDDIAEEIREMLVNGFNIEINDNRRVWQVISVVDKVTSENNLSENDDANSSEESADNSEEGEN